MKQHDIREIEELSLNALPSLNTIFLDGWVLRLANGYTKRANSVNILYNYMSEEGNFVEKVERCEAMYRVRNEKVIFKITDEMHSRKLDKLLMERGYEVDGKVSVQVAELLSISLQDVPGVTMYKYSHPDPDWINSFLDFSNVPTTHRATFVKMIELLIPKTGYFLIKDNETLDVLACGLAVLEGEYVGMFDIITNPAYRNQGYGKRLVESMLIWGQENGAKYAYLQVLQDNKIARKLYSNIGFKELYTYWFRVKE